MVSKLAEYLGKDTALTHLDLSHSSFSKHAGDVLGKALGNNTTLLGLHVAGNPFFVDAHGFLVPREPKRMSAAFSPLLRSAIERADNARQVSIVAWWRLP